MTLLRGAAVARARSLLGACLAPVLVLACASPAARAPVRASGSRSPARAPCLGAVRALLPDTSTQWVFVRPRAVFEHPRLGRALGRAFDDAGEQALFSRAARVGYDVRTVDRALLAWTPTGFVAVGAGAFDVARIADLLWERLLPPRRRAPDRAGRARLEGVLTRDPVALAVDGACGVAAWAEGDTRRVDRALAPPAGAAPDPDALLVWHARDVPDAVRRPAGDALIRRVHDLEVTASARRDGVAIELVLQGDVPPDGGARVRRALRALATSPLGESIGAWAWMRDDAVAIEHDTTSLRLRATAPWRSLDALADVLRGDVGVLR